jgi:hypothetical protein
LHYGTQLTDTHHGTTPIIWEINIIVCNRCPINYTCLMRMSYYLLHSWWLMTYVHV